MEKFLICMFDVMLVGKDILRAKLDERPELGFKYEYLHFEPMKGIAFKIESEIQMPLNDEEQTMIYSFIDNYRFKVWEIDADGICTGEKFIDEVDGDYAHCPPPNLDGNYWYNPNKKQWDYIYGVDEDGKYIGNAPYKDCSYFADRPPNFSYEKWDDKSQNWADKRTVEELKSFYLQSVEEISNNAQKNGALFDGVVWKTSEEEIAKLRSAPDDIKFWKDFSNEEIRLDGFTKNDVLNSILNYNELIRNRKENAIQKINSAKTREEVEAVEW